MAAGEDQPQALVAHRSLLDLFVAGVQQGRLGVAVGAGGLAPQPVDGAVARGGDDPARGARRQPVRGPPLHGRREGVGHRLLGDVDVAEDADQDGHRAAVLRAEDALDLRRTLGIQAGGQYSGTSWNGRTSMGSVVARAALRAQPSAASRSGASTIQNPPMCSLPST